MANAQDAAKQSVVNYSELDTSYILSSLQKMNNMLREYPCPTQLIQDSNNNLLISHHTQEDYELTLQILARHFMFKFNRELVPIPVPIPEPVTAVIELDQYSHHYVKSNIDKLNHTLIHEFFNVLISLSDGCSLQISGPDTSTIEIAFKFLRSQLESLYNENLPVPDTPQQPSDTQYQSNTDSLSQLTPTHLPHSEPTPQSHPSPLQSSNSSDSIDFCIKKWIIPDTLFDACQGKIDSIFTQHDYTYSVQYTGTQNVIVEYEGSSQVLELIKTELENIRKQYTDINQPSATPNTYPLDSQSHFSYQDELDNPVDAPTPPTVYSEQPVIDQTAQLDFIQCQSLPQSNPFYFDLHPNVSRTDGMSNSPVAKKKIQPGSTNPVYNNFSQKEHHTPATEPPVSVPVSNESDYLRGPDTTQSQFQSHPPRDHPANEQSYSNSLATSAGKSKIRSKDNSLTEAMRVKASTQCQVSTSSFNDPKLVTAIGAMSLDTSKQQQQQQQQQQQERPYDTQYSHGTDTQQDRYSHQSLDAIISYHDKFSSVVSLPDNNSYQEAKNLENNLINVRLIQCPSRPRVCTIIADEREMVLYALKELSKKFGQLGYLPACNGIPITSEGIQCFVELDDKPQESRKTKLLASLTCSSGLSIKIKYMNLQDGKWDVVVKSVEPNAISSTRLEYVDILTVVGPNISTADSKRMAETADRLDYWCFYDARSKEQFCKHILRLVIPGWNPNDFKASNLKHSIASILYYCNRQGFETIAFPIIGHESKHIPIPLSAQALLGAIDEFSSRCPSPALKQVDIVITKESCIRAFQYHFITPIQRHLKRHSAGKKSVASDTAQEEEETCPICLEALYTEGQAVRKLVQCKHKFHDLCISKAVESKPRCPLCMSPLGMQRGDQPPGGRMTHTVLFDPLPGYPTHGTIKIQYDIPGGIQTASHPNPGTPYLPTSRTAFLPNNQQGQKVLGLLKTAFERGLIFTIGTSRTLNIDNVITWNDIHHKTMPTGTEHGYPDTGYLDRVIAELRDKGVE